MPKQANAAMDWINAFIQGTSKEVWLKHKGRMQWTLNIYPNFPLDYFPLYFTTKANLKTWL